LEEERSAKYVEYDLEKLAFEGNDQLNFFCFYIISYVLFDRCEKLS